MSSTIPTIIEDLLRDAGEEWTQVDRDRAAIVVEDSARLALRAAMGADVSREAAQVRAQLASMAATAEIRAASVVRAAVDRLVGIALDRILGTREN